MFKLGFHVSIAGSLEYAVDRAVKIGCNTFQIFTRNPRSWMAKDLKAVEAQSFSFKVKKYGIKPVFAHMPYLVNLASRKTEIYNLSVSTLRNEMRRCKYLNIPFLVTHLGSHLGAGKAKGCELVSKAINQSINKKESGVKLLLENTAGSKNNIGDQFDDIKRIIEGISEPDMVGICFDTSHAFAAGYDISSYKAVRETITQFDQMVGVEKIRLVHLNDSKGNLGSRVDRHEHIGLGKIGEKGIKAILGSELGILPLIMETPRDYRRGDLQNLQKVKEIIKECF